MTWNHNENRSRFEMRDQGQGLIAVLADNCIAAFDALKGTGRDISAARDYLLRLTELKEAIVEMQIRTFRASQA